MWLRVGPARAAVLAAGLVSCGALEVGVLRAEPLTLTECEAVRGEHSALVTAGAQEHLSRGPEWGKANLNAAQLRSVERYLTLEEQLNYRCGLAKLRTALPVAEEDQPPAAPAPLSAAPAAPALKPGGGKGSLGTGAGAPRKAGGAQVAEPSSAEVVPAKPKPKPKPKAAVLPDTSPDESAKGGAPPKAKRKPKLDDAYRPAAPSGTGEGTPLVR